MCITSHLLEEPNNLCTLFVRRKDIDEQSRVKIGILTNYYPRHGLVTSLAERYQVSRPFIYHQKALVKQALSVLNPGSLDSPDLIGEENIKQLLLYRIRGSVSISKCSDFLSENNCANTSEGWISEQIKYLGDLVGNVVLDWEGSVVFASDEIYMVNDIPVLVTVDPVSSAILSITVCKSLNKELWESHWSNLVNKGIEPLSLVGDEGKSLKAAHKSSHESVTYQPDTFHAITQRFGKVSNRLERAALSCIQKEYEREKVYLNAKSEQNQVKQSQLYQQSQQATQKALSLLSDFKWLYGQINRQLKVVRSDGSIRRKQWAEGEVQAALELMEETLAIDLEQQINAVRKLLPDLFQYLDQAQRVYTFLAKQIPGHLLPFYLLYWQYQRELNNLKKARDKNRFTKSKQYLIQILQEYQKQQAEVFEQERQLVFAAMQGVVQSSAMVECINSILRPIFNESKGQVSQQTLNLVMYWHNHRVYKKGKRKGKSPIELLTGNKPKVEWRQAIIDLAKKEQALRKVA